MIDDNDKEIEKIEIDTKNRRIFYTGTLEDLKDGWIKIKTIRNEVVKVRKEQVMWRRMLTEDEINKTRNENENENNKNIQVRSGNY